MIKLAAASGVAMLASQLQGAESTSLAGNSVPIELHWLDGPPRTTTGVTWGVPWPRGTVKADQRFDLKTEAGVSVPMQTWPLAFWADGSVKWTAHACAADASGGQKLLLAPGTPPV